MAEPNPTYYDRAKDAAVPISDEAMAEGRRLYRLGYRQVSRKFRHVARGDSHDVLNLNVETFEALRAEARAAELDSLPAHDWPIACAGPRFRGPGSKLEHGKLVGAAYARRWPGLGAA